MVKGEASADKSVQACCLVADGVPREFGGGAHRRAVVSHHHSTVGRRLLRRDDSRTGKAATLHST